MSTKDELEITLADFYHPFTLALKNTRKLKDIKLAISKSLPNTLIASEPVYLQTSKIKIDPRHCPKITTSKSVVYCATAFLLLNKDSIHTLTTPTGLYRKECLELIIVSKLGTLKDLINFLKELLAKEEPVLIPLVEQQTKQSYNDLVKFRFVEDQKINNSENKPTRVDVLVVEIPSISKYGITTEQEIIKKVY